MWWPRAGLRARSRTDPAHPCSGSRTAYTRTYLDLGLDQGADAHGARLVGREDGDLRQPMPIQLVCGGLHGTQDSRRGRLGRGRRFDGRARARSWRRRETATAPMGASPSAAPRRAWSGDRLGHEQRVFTDAESSRRGPARPPYPSDRCRPDPTRHRAPGDRDGGGGGDPVVGPGNARPGRSSSTRSSMPRTRACWRRRPTCAGSPLPSAPPIPRSGNG